MFGRLFNLDAPFWQGVARVGDIVLLNILFVVTSLPIVTMGAAMAALYDTIWRVQDSRGGGTTRLYFASFASNFLQATLLWLAVAPAGIALILSWVFLPIQELVILKASLSLIYLLLFPYVWMLQARFSNSVGRTLLNSFLIAASRAPYSAGVLLIHVALLILTSMVIVNLPQTLPPLILGGYAMVVYASMPLLVRAISPWFQPEEPDAS